MDGLRRSQARTAGVPSFETREAPRDVATRPGGTRTKQDLEVLALMQDSSDPARREIAEIMSTGRTACVMVPVQLLNVGVSADALVVLMRYLSMTRERRQNYSSGQVAVDMGMSHRSVLSRLRELEGLGLILVSTDGRPAGWRYVEIPADGSWAAVGAGLG